jgi:ferredoxin
METLKTSGAISQQELKVTEQHILPDRRYTRPVAVLECIEEIPCNPCETACPFGAITIGEEITKLPSIDLDLCTGCALCVAACPGLAIYLKQEVWGEDLSYIAFPYEYHPLPVAGEEVILVDRKGDTVCTGEVQRVVMTKRFDRTAIVHVTYPSEYYAQVVNMQRR